MRDDLPVLLERLDQAEQMVNGLASIILAGRAEFSSTWDSVNRICDRYFLAQQAEAA